jgi:hypothetical protein
MQRGECNEEECRVSKRDSVALNKEGVEMPISIEGVISAQEPAQGISVTWDDGQFVVIVCPNVASHILH